MKKFFAVSISTFLFVAALALAAAFYGAWMITAANRERQIPDGPRA